jgi:hypothetical protein
MSRRLKEKVYPMLNYAPPCLHKFPQGTPGSPMLSSPAPPCLSLGNTVDTKEARDTIAFEAPIFGAKTHDRKAAKNSI